MVPLPRAGALLTAGVAALVALALCPLPAHAQTRVAVWSVTASGGDGAKLLGTELSRSLVGGLAASGLAVVTPAEVQQRMATHPGLAGCTTSVCLRRGAEVLKVSLLIQAEIEVFGSSYAYRLQSVGADGAVRRRASGRCDVCTMREANERVSQAAVELLQSEPPSTQPSSDATPPSPSAPVPAATVARPASPRKRISLRVWKWTSLGVAAATLAVGATLVALHGNGSCTPELPGATCPRIYDTQAAGWALTTLGVAGLGGAGVLFWLDWPQPSAPPTMGVQLAHRW